MARRAIILGVNQTIMMALSMVVITALIDAPGLGKNILRPSSRAMWGPRSTPGIAIVIMAIILDRLTDAAATGSTRRTGPTQSDPRLGASARLARSVLRSAIPVVASFVVDATRGGASFPSRSRLARPVNTLWTG